MNKIVNVTPRVARDGKPWLRLGRPLVAMAAAMLLVAVFFHYTPSGGTPVAFADVVRNLEEFRPYSCLESIEANGRTNEFARHFFMSRTVRRSEFPNGTVIIFDLSDRSELWLSPAEKKAVKHTYPNVPPGQHASIYDMVEKWTAMGNGPESLGTRRIEDRECSGFHSSDGQNNDITVWVDNQTLLPVRTEVVHVKDGNKIVCSDFKFNINLDPALFSMEPPEGYASGEVITHKEPGQVVKEPGQTVKDPEHTAQDPKEFIPYSCLEAYEDVPTGFSLRRIVQSIEGVFGFSGKAWPARHFFLSRTIRRTEFSDGRIVIFDLGTRDELVLWPKERRAVKYVYPGSPPAEHTGIDEIVDRNTKIFGKPESLGTEVVEGKECSVYHWNDAKIGDCRVWADTRTGLPVQTEFIRYQDQRRIAESEFTLDIDLDPALYSMEPPEGYTFKVVEQKQ